MSESAIGVPALAARGHRGCNTLQFSFSDLALVLPNRGVAMVYLAGEDD
jgi:hypothetical protein